MTTHPTAFKAALIQMAMSDDPVVPPSAPHRPGNP